MSSRQYHFRIRLHGKVIISESSATAGAHSSLDFIPGATLLGLAASRLYPELSATEGWSLFQSGEVIFSDALPLGPHDVPALPMPLSWHCYKDQAGQVKVSDEQGTTLAANQLFDPARQAPEPGRQPQQQRGGYVTPGGDFVSPALDSCMKTAIDPKTARAAESQLFGYQSLAARQTFQFSLHIASSVPAALVDTLLATLEGPARLGRSRSAEFGAVHIESCSAAAQLSQSQPQDDGLLRLWCLSDLALPNDACSHGLTPEPHWLGLPEGSRWCADKSYLRSRSYSPYNAHRRCYDPQRQVINRGSVLVFELPTTHQAHWAAESLLRAGLYRQAGLGLMAVNPALLARAQPVFSATAAPAALSAAAPPLLRPNTPLLNRLAALAVQTSQADNVQQDAERCAEQLHDSFQQALRWQGRASLAELDLPSQAQWGAIRTLANDHRHAHQLLWQTLFLAENALIRDRDGQPCWRMPLDAKTTLSMRFKTIMQPWQDDPALPELLSRLAGLMRRHNTGSGVVSTPQEEQRCD